MPDTEDLRAEVARLKVEFDRCERAWKKLCRQHGGAKAATRLAWGQDEALAMSIRAVRWPREAAKAAYRKALQRLKVVGLYVVVESCLESIREAEVTDA